MTVAEARTVLEEGEAERMFPADVIAKEAVRLTESDGIVFIDEIDKVRLCLWKGCADAFPHSCPAFLLPYVGIKLTVTRATDCRWQGCSLARGGPQQ